MRSAFVVVAIGASTAVLACSGKAGGGESLQGETCSRTEDCAADLRCVDAKCMIVALPSSNPCIAACNASVACSGKANDCDKYCGYDGAKCVAEYEAYDRCHQRYGKCIDGTFTSAGSCSAEISAVFKCEHY